MKVPLMRDLLYIVADDHTSARRVLILRTTTKTSKNNAAMPVKIHDELYHPGLFVITSVTPSDWFLAIPSIAEKNRRQNIRLFLNHAVRILKDFGYHT